MSESRQKTGRKAPKTAFQPGKSGNPGGRPKQTPEQKDALKMIRDLAPEAAERLRDIILDPGTKTNDLLRAIEIVFDRALGKETFNAPNEMLRSLFDLERGVAK